MHIDAVIFDCDGTLVDSERLASEVLVELVAEFGLSISVDDAVRAYTGGKMADCVADLERLLGRQLQDGFVADLRARTAAAFVNRLKPMAGAREAVSRLRVPCCVASSGPREKIELSLRTTGLLDLFEGSIFSSYEVGFWKPDPRLFLHVAAKLGVSPERCAVVEDSVFGVTAAISAGMRTFAFDPHGQLDQNWNWPERVTRLARLADLPDQIDALGPERELRSEESIYAGDRQTPSEILKAKG
jgi:HAD superfamily hydrolase (TIGR01509 family)